MIKNIPISADKVGRKLQTFGSLALPDVELFHEDDFDEISCCEEEFSANIDHHTTVKADG